jgi:hypothetical protein
MASCDAMALSNIPRLVAKQEDFHSKACPSIDRSGYETEDTRVHLSENSLGSTLNESGSGCSNEFSFYILSPGPDPKIVEEENPPLLDGTQFDIQVMYMLLLDPLI